MKAYILSDDEFFSKRYFELANLITSSLKNRGFDVEHKTISRGELAFCSGCFDCWVRTPGECIVKDEIAQINRACMTSDVVVYLTPVVFGQFSANIKSAIDRWLPNMLPFFITRKDGSTMHPPRYTDYPAQVILGYGEHLSKEETELFSDITKKHRNNVALLIDRGDDELLRDEFSGLNLSRTGGSL